MIFTNDEMLISIIVPLYNVQKYVKRCLESLKIQSYKNIEVIIVDDGSTDYSYEVSHEVTKSDDRFTIIKKTNGGLSSARNCGLDNCKGDFVTFIDSDDYVDKDYIFNLLKPFIDNKECDISISRIIEVDTEGHELLDRNDCKQTTYVDSNIAMKRMFLRDKFNHCAYGKLYKKTFWYKELFPNGRLYEDYLTTYKVFSKANIVALVDSQDYFYVQQSNSIMHMPLSSKTMSILEVSEEVTNWINLYHPRLLNSALELQMATYLKVFQNIFNHNKKLFIEEQNRIKIFYKNNFWKILKYRSTPKNDRIKIILFFISKFLFIKVCNYANRIK